MRSSFVRGLIAAPALIAGMASRCTASIETNMTSAEIVLDIVEKETAQVLVVVREYGALLVHAIIMVTIGLAIVFLVHRLVARPLARRIRNHRLIRVIFGFLYALVLVFTVLLAIDRMGFNIGSLGDLAVLVLILGAVMMYFLAPFLPRLPFTLGQMVEIGGMLGFVDSVSYFHVTVRMLDGRLVFMPVPLVLSSKIVNYSSTPTRRVELAFSLSNGSNLSETMDTCLRIMRDDGRVLEEPSPPAIYVVDASVSGVEMMAYCWVKNEDWFRTRSDLWLKLVELFELDARFALARPQQEVILRKQNSARDRIS